MQRVKMTVPYLGIIVMLALMPVTPAVRADAGELTVVYTGNAEGKLRFCGCPGDPYGGYIERATLLSRLRAIETRPFLLVDGGNMVDLFGLYEEQAGTVMRLMNHMGYDAALAGANELFHGIGATKRMTEIASFPLIAATVAEENSRKNILPPATIVTVNDVTVGIIGLVDDGTFQRLGSMGTRNYRFLDPERALKNTLDSFDTAPDYMVVLSQLTHEQNTAILERHPSVDLIVETATNMRYDEPAHGTGGYIVSPGTKGQFVGLIVLDHGADGTVMVEHEFLPVKDMPPDRASLAIVDGKHTGPSTEENR